MKTFLFASTLLLLQTGFSQDYTSYPTGNSTDLDTVGQSGVCLMGGATEDDNAMIWFLERANQGDVLVLRASGSDGYNDYMYNQLGVTLNSVETIVCNNANASSDAYLLDKVAKAEAIWFAGGDQWDYVSYWRNTAVDSIINDHLTTKNLVIGGTSAGMAIQGRYYFSAENGTVTSATALADPYDANVTADSNAFIHNEYLEDVITDTHFDNPDRKGRLSTFLARIVTDYGVFGKGIACDEYTAVCIDENGIASVYGGYPTYDDNAYFIQMNCDLFDSNPLPEDCSSGNPLDWNLNSQALVVYEVKGTASGTNTFNLNDWETANGGDWKLWWVDNGTFNEGNGFAPNCSLSVESIGDDISLKVYPNPTSDILNISADKNISAVHISDLQGKTIYNNNNPQAVQALQIETSDWATGFYVLEIMSEGQTFQFQICKH